MTAIRWVALDYSRTLTAVHGPRDPELEMRLLTPDAVEVLRTLHRRGFELLLASNCLRSRRPALKRAGVDEIFADFIESCDPTINAAKPQRRFYDAVLLAAGCRPDEVLFTGDNMLCDVLGPLEAGMHAALVGPEPEPGMLPPAAHHLNSISDLPGLLEKLCG